MSGSGFALVFGLLLLGLAVWLLRRANSSSFRADANPEPLSSSSLSQEDDRPQDSEMDSWLEDDPDPEPEPEPEPAVDSVAEETSGSGGLSFGGARRKRRAWASEHGFEYAKEDKSLAAAWPRSVVGAGHDSEGAPVARDVVSGFTEGHLTHFADVGGHTLVAMRRVEFSPVSVHYSTELPMPEGMRRIEPLDQPPFVAYTSDVRALDRMLDARVEDGLQALSQVSSEVVWEADWLILRISRKLDVSVWDKILPHVRSLADAAMVLPPESLSIPLEMDLADQTRPMPGGALVIETRTKAVGAGVDKEENLDDEMAGGHLRAVPDVEPVGDVVAGEAAEYAAVEDERPDITRPAEPVVFPSRSTGRSEGAPERFEDFHVADPDDADPDGHLPKLGEDPEHIQPSTARRAHVIRSDEEHEATIFDEYSADDAAYEEPVTPYVDSVQPAEGVEYAEEEEALSHISRLRRDHRRRSGGGRHRAPDARHARPEPIEAVETEDIETVDGEIVDED